MSQDMCIIRFPDGEAEFYAGAHLPSVGDTLTRRGAVWAVASVQARPDGHTVAILMPSEVERDPMWPDPYAFIWKQ